MSDGEKTEYEQTLFDQISLSQYKDFFTMCFVKRFKECNTKLYHAELLSLNIYTFIELVNAYIVLKAANDAPRNAFQQPPYNSVIRNKYAESHKVVFI